MTFHRSAHACDSPRVRKQRKPTGTSAHGRSERPRVERSADGCERRRVRASTGASAHGCDNLRRREQAQTPTGAKVAKTDGSERPRVERSADGCERPRVAATAHCGLHAATQAWKRPLGRSAHGSNRPRVGVRKCNGSAHARPGSSQLVLVKQDSSFFNKTDTMSPYPVWYTVINQLHTADTR